MVSKVPLVQTGTQQKKDTGNKVHLVSSKVIAHLHSIIYGQFPKFCNQFLLLSSDKIRSYIRKILLLMYLRRLIPPCLVPLHPSVLKTN